MMETDARASSEKHHCPGYKSAPSHSNLFLVVNELLFASNSRRWLFELFGMSHTSILCLFRSSGTADRRYRVGGTNGEKEEEVASTTSAQKFG